MGRFAFVCLGLLLMALPLSATGAPKPCPSGVLTYNNSCYQIFLKAKTWNNAEMFCRAQKTGCHLASIHSLEDSRRLSLYVSWYLKFRNIWIGLSTPNRQRSWQWSDGSRMSYQRWTKGQASSLWRNEKCAELRSWSWYYTWNVRDCNLLRPFLCQCPLQPQSEGSTWEG